jgi:hypothetical protein
MGGGYGRRPGGGGAGGKIAMGAGAGLLGGMMLGNVSLAAVSTLRSVDMQADLGWLFVLRRWAMMMLQITITGETGTISAVAVMTLEVVISASRRTESIAPLPIGPLWTVL